MNYDGAIDRALDRLHEEGRYRTFIDIERRKGAYPQAIWSAPDGSERDITVWCGNDYLGMGQHPLVLAAMHEALEATGNLSLWRLAIKPGKPLAFGAIDGTPLLGLPGNPAAVLVTFAMIVMPFIRQCQGQPRIHPVGERLPADFEVPSPSIRRGFFRARKEHKAGELCLAAHPNQSSGMLSSACWADGLAVIPENSEVRIGDVLTYYSFTELLA